MFKDKVPILFSGTEGFPSRRDGRYCLQVELLYVIRRLGRGSSYSCVQLSISTMVLQSSYKDIVMLARERRGDKNQELEYTYTWPQERLTWDPACSSAEAYGGLDRRNSMFSPEVLS